MVKILKDFKMNDKKTTLACITALLALSACALHQTAKPEGATEEKPQQLCVDCQKDPFVNYTQTRADFRQYGELSPRDQRVSQSGAGNNLSAAVPPSIDNEVITYEQYVEESEQKAAEQPLKENVALEQTDEIVVAEVVEAETETETETEKTSVEDPVQDWYAEEGQNLKALLTEWSEQSGWRLVWNTNRNYVLSAGAMFRGRFADVSSALIRAFARARPAPVATFYKGNRVLVVETMEDENAYN